MPGRSVDLQARINSSFDGTGFKSAEASAKVLERELAKVENAQRQMVQQELAAYREGEQRAAAAAAAVEASAQRRRTAMTQVGKTALGVGATVALGLGVSAKAAMDWESAWAGVRKTVDGSDEEMAALEKELRSLAGTLPATHEEIAAVAEAAGQLGVSRKDVAAFTKTAIDMGESTNVSAEDAATGLAQLGNVMGVLPKQADRAGSALVALGNDGASTEADILAMSLRIAGAGRTIGLTEAQVMGLASGLSSVGIEAEAGGSAISKVMVDIAQSVSQGGDAVEGFAKVAGMSTDDFSKAFRKDAAGAVLSFIEGLGRMQKSGADTFTVLDDLGFKEIRVRDALLRTSNAGDLLRESVDLGSKAWKENTALVEEANKRYATSEARVEMARNKLNDAAIDIGANVLPALAGAADRAGALGEAFHGLPPHVQEGVAALGGIVATAGLVGGSALVLIPKVHDLTKALGEMGPRGQSAAAGIGKVGKVLTGPWGLALGAATIALGMWAEAQYEAGQRVDDLAATLDQQTGAITDNTRAEAANQLQKRGALDAARALGLSLETVTEAALGNSAAVREVDLALAAVAKSAKGAGHNPFTGESGSSAQNDAKKLREQLEGYGIDLDKAQRKTLDLAEAKGKDAEASEESAEATSGLSKTVDAATTAAKDAEDAISELSKALDNMNGVGLSAIDAQIGWQDSIAKATEQLHKQGKGLDLTTEKGRANQGALNDMAKAAGAMADSILQETGSEEQFRASLTQSRDALYQTALRFGMTEDEAHAYVDRVLSIPVEAPTSIKLTGAQQAMADIAAVQARMAALNGTTSTVAVRFRRQGGTVSALIDIAVANGAVLDYYAAGGMSEQHTAQIAPAGAWRVWAEPETGGEAYIPLSQAKRDRSTALLGEVADRFGYALVRRFDVGGWYQPVPQPTAPAQAPAAAPGPLVAIDKYIEMTGSPAEVGRAVQYAAVGRI